jgi:uroporphyrin-III C-methyltransferase/precorrin-2 dehydrogenase/sirohydrochlorin ferrochelatase
MTGLVSLVGAGPGDPDLLTRRALDRLARADLVLDDALVPTDLLELAPRAHRFYVGKRAGRHSIDQDEIHRLMIRAAGRGSRVVRLKCGDPFVLGRGGEEGLALAAAGVPFEIVPGLSSAIAGPALAGIPVTHRGLAAGFVVVSGHAPEAWQPVLAGLAPACVTVVVLMGLRQRAAIAADLIARGWARELPAAIVLAAGTAQQSTWTGSLAALATAELADQESPGILVIGEVVRLAPTLASAVASTPLRTGVTDLAARSAVAR